MGVLNVTPDSFSDGDKFFDTGRALDHAFRMIDEGADFIDVGGESTRPGAIEVSADEELRRVIPVIERLTGKTSVPVSIDTTKSQVAGQALDAGALIVNDISGLQFDPRIARTAAARSATLILMHTRGRPAVMQQDILYQDVWSEITSYLHRGINLAHEAGITQIILDPGLGFGKAFHHNMTILRDLNPLRSLGYPVMVGPSRKSFIGKILDLPPDQREDGTAASVAIAISRGANIVRVHDVLRMKRVAQVVDAILRE